MVFPRSYSKCWVGTKNSTLYCMFPLHTSPGLTSNFSPKRSLSKGIKISLRLVTLPRNTNSVQMLFFYKLHTPSLVVPEGRAGTGWAASVQWDFLSPLSKNACRVSHYTLLSSSSSSFYFFFFFFFFVLQGLNSVLQHWMIYVVVNDICSSNQSILLFLIFCVGSFPSFRVFVDFSLHKEK